MNCTKNLREHCPWYMFKDLKWKGLRKGRHGTYAKREFDGNLCEGRKQLNRAVPVQTIHPRLLDSGFFLWERVIRESVRTKQAAVMSNFQPRGPPELLATIVWRSFCSSSSSERHTKIVNPNKSEEISSWNAICIIFIDHLSNRSDFMWITCIREGGR